ncbi:serine hydrolase [Kitasatospora acidiphila]|uniref:serine hydrolase n=1 Tax=Kitasatospora acidiphila TaxID=2567942 RepID=UPI001E41C450|nr:serine hydrolase domain-containing protein [Kitasatospora acidiphila]
MSGFLPAAAVAERVPASPPGSVMEGIEQAVADGFPGAVAYARRGESQSRMAAGLADTATGERVRPDQRFRIAGNTKSFVSTVLLQLEGEGRLSLDDSVEKWLPGTVQAPPAGTARTWSTQRTVVSRRVQVATVISSGVGRPPRWAAGRVRACD